MNGRTTPDRTERKKRTWLRGSHIVALVFMALVAVWMFSGEIVVGGSDHDKIAPIGSTGATTATGTTTGSNEGSAPRFHVAARRFSAAPRREVLHVRGRTEAESEVDIRAETGGRVIAISGKKGRLVTAGTVLCQLDEGSRKATLSGAEAQRDQTRSDYLAAKKLGDRGFSAQLNVAAKRAAFEAAAAALEKAQLDLTNTRIKAPFTGLIADQPAKIGDYLTLGNGCARMVRIDPLLVVGEVSERRIGTLKVGQKGTARLVTGEEAKGHIRFIAPNATAATRTFRIELEVPNKNLKMRAGVTADVFLPLDAVKGHFISPALLTLNDEGRVGVRTIENGDTVRFRPVEILDQSKAGVWIAGLPDKVTIITTGQDYVIDGQKVGVSLEKPETERKAKPNVRS